MKFGLLLFTVFLGSTVARAANEVSSATATIIAAIGIQNVSALNFGTGTGGDAALTIPPGTVENASNGSFNVTGQANRTYQITLPANGTVTMVTGGGGSFKTIGVNSFTSFPANTGTLSAAGAQLLLVGATRAALSPSQFGGVYSATYTVTVIY